MSLTTKVLSLKEIIQYRRTYFEILGNLTSSSMMDVTLLGERYTKATQSGSHFLACFDSSGDMVGVVTLLIEYKLTKGGSKAAHIEELVVRKGYEGRGIGSTLLQSAIDLADNEGCYKIILECDNNLAVFYEKQGFKNSGIFFRKYLMN